MSKEQKEGLKKRLIKIIKDCQLNISDKLTRKLVAQLIQVINTETQNAYNCGWNECAKDTNVKVFGFGKLREENEELKKDLESRKKFDGIITEMARKIKQLKKKNEELKKNLKICLDRIEVLKKELGR